MLAEGDQDKRAEQETAKHSQTHTIVHCTSKTRTQKFSKIIAQAGTVSKQLRERWNRKMKICTANLKDYTRDYKRLDI